MLELNKRFIVFRKTLDGEMKDATKDQKMWGKEEITEREETILWNMALLGANTEAGPDLVKCRQNTA